MKQKLNENGFSMVEIIIALLMLGLIFLGGVRVIGVHTHAYQDDRFRTQALELAKDTMEYIKKRALGRTD